jgi:hypothetical protein
MSRHTHTDPCCAPSIPSQVSEERIARAHCSHASGCEVAARIRRPRRPVRGPRRRPAAAVVARRGSPPSRRRAGHRRLWPGASLCDRAARRARSAHRRALALGPTGRCPRPDRCRLDRSLRRLPPSDPRGAAARPDRLRSLPPRARRQYGAGCGAPRSPASGQGAARRVCAAAASTPPGDPTSTTPATASSRRAKASATRPPTLERAVRARGAAGLPSTSRPPTATPMASSTRSGPSSAAPTTSPPSPPSAGASSSHAANAITRRHPAQSTRTQFSPGTDSADRPRSPRPARHHVLNALGSRLAVRVARRMSPVPVPRSHRCSARNLSSRPPRPVPERRRDVRAGGARIRRASRNHRRRRVGDWPGQPGLDSEAAPRAGSSRRR